MAKKPDNQTNLGVYDTPKNQGMSAIEVIAIALSALWLLGSAVFFLGMGGTSVFEAENRDTLQFVMTLLAVFLPVAVIWVAASAARSARIVREESRRLQAAIDAMRQTYVADRQAHGIAKQPEVEKKLDEIAQAAKQTETAVATFASSREKAGAAPARAAESKPSVDMDQPALQLGTPPEDLEPPVDRADFIRALNFPETAEDQEGFTALRRALKDRKAAGLIQASQDVLTLLSQDGIYMDDLRPDRAKPDIWRRFAQGERGAAVAVLGGIRDRSALALAAGRMRSDAIFRDAVHHFLRKFDTMLSEFEQDATDEDISELSNTRTARAFMLMGRVTGMFS
ncbi:hypothetical protein [Shimia ponticola]|uniref:hypothetical protein n=1 Tax=Shimia ponticola TaxID=2582893 RepID=UPI0011BEDB80|nr:hypothetical protein [Shimia ponticola]